MSKKAVIIGAGIGGLTAAVALRRAGFEVAVFERRTDPSKIQAGGGIHLWHNAMRALQQLGLAEGAQAVGSVVERAEFCSWRGATLAAWPVGELGRKLDAPTVGVIRADLQREVLAAALEPETLRLGMECTGFTQDESGVTARFADGSEERGDVLIGADGINSAVRAQRLGKIKPRYAGYTVWQGVCDFDHEKTPPGTFRVFYGPGRRFAFYHVGGERLYWFGLVNTPEGGRDPEGQVKAGLIERFAGGPEPVAGILAATEEAAISRLDMQDRKPIPRWSEGRVTLLGDAAHPMTFNVGQGACQAIEDGLVLSERLRECPDDIPAALRAYQDRRMKRAHTIMKFAWNLGVICRWQNPIACRFRDQVMRGVLGGVALRQHEADMVWEF